jgi:molybdopterin-guanine dinucleotide biosynthesis protein A
MTGALRGLVLAGGRSTRMGRDKAVLAYHGRDQLQVAFELLGEVAGPNFVSVRADQTSDPLRARYAQVIDGTLGVGPVAGILAALRTRPAAAWLVLACDLPFLDASTLRALIAGRDPSRVATAFRSAYDGLPEPLCAIWEPQCEPLLADFVAADGRCPRKFLLAHAARIIDLPRSNALDNINSTTEYRQAMQDLDPTTKIRPLDIQYFALLREQAGCAHESLQSAARTPRDLYLELQTRHRFTLPLEMLRVAINGDFAEWDHPLEAADHVVFIPPVAGG